MKTFIAIIIVCLFSCLFVNASNAFAQSACPKTLEEVKKNKGYKKINACTYEAVQKGYELRCSYYKSGNLEEETPFVNGKMEGLARKYHKNGKIRKEANLVADKIEGVAKEYYESGKLKAEMPFVGNRIEGTAKQYYESGALQVEGSYVDGKGEGFTKIYYESGKITSEALYKNGKVDGSAKLYHENGKLKQEIPFDKQGLVDGELQVYDEKGKIILAITCVADSPVSGICYKKDSTTRALTKEELKDWKRREIMPKCE